MTTTPAPTDLDALKALQDRARRLVSWQSRIDLLQRHDALLDELATYKAEVKHADAEREEAERQRDAARAELDEARQLIAWGAEQVTNAQAETTDGVRKREQAEQDRDAAREELAKIRAALAREERLHGETIDDRDASHEAADKLAEAIAAAAGVDIGEHSNMNDPWANALDAMPKLVAELAEATRELAKTRAELAETHTELDRLRGVIREGVDMAEWHRNEITTWKRKAAKLREQLGNAKARISAAATVEVWTNEDGKRFVFADDLMRALDPNPEANPATTAEPADEPKARREPKLKRADIFDEILAYPCPSCGVSAGTVCVNRNRRFSHIKRRTLASANAEPAAS